MNPFFTKVVVREDIWQGKAKTFLIDHKSHCCIIESGWPLNHSRIRVKVRREISGRHGGRDVVEVIARELIHLRHFDPVQYALLEVDHELKHTTLGGAVVRDVLNSLDLGDDQDYETALRNHKVCQFRPTKCFSPFHTGIALCSEEVTPEMLSKCTEAFVKHPALISHPKAHITIGVPIYAYRQARAEFIVVRVKEREKEQLRLSQLADSIVADWEDFCE